MKKSIHIIGGGIIGLCSAFYLEKEGYDVTIIDSGKITNGASFGNAGMIVPSHFVPMAAPGVISKGIKWMFDNKSPFYIKPRLNIELLQWLWQFYKSCTTEHVSAAMPILYEFNNRGKQLFEHFSNSNQFNFDFEKKGMLMLYKSKHQEIEEVQMAEQAHCLGIKAIHLSTNDLKEMEPNIDLDVLGGVYYPDDAHLSPNKFMHQLINDLDNKGVKIIRNTKIIDFNKSNGTITQLKSDKNEIIKIENLVIASGTWSAKLLRKLGLKISLQGGKGYSMTIDRPLKSPKLPTILTEAKVAITPMGNKLRVGGTLELGGHPYKINNNRVKGILESLTKYYPNIQFPQQELLDIFHGFRPCTPDGMPYIGRSPILSNLIIATGHGMMGLSTGPATGEMVSQIATGKPTTCKQNMYKLSRF